MAKGTWFKSPDTIINLNPEYGFASLDGTECGCRQLHEKAEANSKSTEERFLEEEKDKDVGVDLGKPTSVNKSSEFNKNTYESERDIVVDVDDDDADELGEVQVAPNVGISRNSINGSDVGISRNSIYGSDKDS